MDRDNASTATQSESDRKISRRGVMRKATAVGVGSAATVGGASRMGGSPVGSARAVAPIVLGGTAAAAAAVGYLINEGIDAYIGDSNEDYSEVNGDAVQTQIRENVLNMKQSNTAVLGNMQNLLSSSKNYVIAEAKKKAIDELNNQNGTQAAKDAVKAEVDSFYTTQQENIASHYNAVRDRVISWFNQVESTDAINDYEVWEFELSDGTTQQVTGKGTATDTYTLVDGSDLTYDQLTINASNPQYYGLRTDPNGSLYILPISDSGDRIQVLDEMLFRSVLTEIESIHSSIKSNMTTWVDEVGQKYQAGEIDSSDLISPTDLTGDGATNDDFSQAGAQLAAMGLQSSKFALSIELTESGETVEGSIYHSDDSIDSLQKDVQYDPESDIEGTVYLAYNNTEEDKGELIELSQPFIIRSITDGSGNEYSAANYESKNQQTYDSQITAIEEELNQVRELREELEEQRAAEATGGGAGGFLSGSSDTRTLGIVAGAAALAALLVGNN